MAVIWATTDRLGRTVVLTDSAWSHIQARHPEFVGRHYTMWPDVQRAIRRAIKLADDIRQDRSIAHREIHYRRAEPGQTWLRVAVHYRPSEFHGWTGEIVTAHVTNDRNRREVQLWPSANLN